MFTPSGVNFAIATTTPRYTLDVWGDFAVGTSTGVTAPMNYPLLFVNSGEGGTSNGVGIGTTTLAGLLTVGTTTPSLVVASNGRVGIATSTPSDIFAVQGTSFFSATTTIADGLVVGGSDLYVSSNGNIGIGTTTPATTLDVYGNLLLDGSSRYLNFGSVVGSSGYGFRDNAGTIEYSNSGGAWAGIGTGGGGSNT